MRRALPLVLLLAACKKEPTPPAPAASASVAVATPSSSAAPASSHDAARPEEEAARVVRAWNDALDKHDVAALESVYADNVVFYKMGSKSKASVIAIKKSALGPKSSFHQQIMDKIHVKEESAGEYHATFTKRSGNGAKLGDTKALIVLSGKPLRITQERDFPRPKESCEEVASSIAWNTDAVKKAMDGVRKELPKFPDRTEGGIGPETFEDGTIQASIGVHHPDRFERIASYVVYTNGRLDISVGADNLTTDPSGETFDSLPAKKLPEADRKRVTDACSHTHEHDMQKHEDHH